MKDESRINESLKAAQGDVDKLFEGFEVPDEYRTRLTAYIQCWYLDQKDCGGRVCVLQGDRAAAAN